mgnify:FL=1
MEPLDSGASRLRLRTPPGVAARGTHVNVRRPARTTVALATAAMALGLSSCSYDNPTDMVYDPAIGVNDQSSDVFVLNAVIVKGSDTSTDGTLVTTLVNKAAEDDQLAGVEVGGEDQGAGVSGGTSTVELPADESVVLDSDSDLSVSGEPVQDGAFITLTYTFANAEAVTMEVPVVVQGEGYYEDVETP